jgi:hypothetical protein
VQPATPPHRPELLLEAPRAPLDAGAAADIIAVVEALLSGIAAVDDAPRRIFQTGIAAFYADVVGHRPRRQWKPLCIGIRPTKRRDDTKASSK